MYDSSNIFTGTHVIKCMKLGIPSPIVMKGKDSKNQWIASNNHRSVRNKIVAKAIWHAYLITYSKKHFGITKDDDLEIDPGICMIV